MAALGGRDYHRLTVLDDRDHAVGRAEIDTDNFCHDNPAFPDDLLFCGYRSYRWRALHQ
jgi:hypothetical protein